MYNNTVQVHELFAVMRYLLHMYTEYSPENRLNTTALCALPSHFQRKCTMEAEKPIVYRTVRHCVPLRVLRIEKFLPISSAKELGRVLPLKTCSWNSSLVAWRSSLESLWIPATFHFGQSLKGLLRPCLPQPNATLNSPSLSVLSRNHDVIVIIGV